MASSSRPFLNTQDSSLNANSLVFTRYDKSMNVEMLPEENIMLYIPENVILGMLLKMMLRMLLMLMHTYQSYIWQIWKNNM
jgi:hypothetical protein